MAPRVLRKPCYALAEICTRWGVTEADLANFALADELVLSAMVVRQPIEEGAVEEVDPRQLAHLPERHHWFSGGVELWAQDAWQIVIVGSSRVTSFRAAQNRYRRVWAPDDEAAEVVLTRDRLVVMHAELIRFEAAQGGDVEVLRPAAGPASPRGAPARYDWDAFWCELAVMLQVEGMPPTQAAVIRRMEAWFAERGQFPDPSTVKRKVALLWRHHAEALARPAA
jgi:hypothetical protein